MKSESIISKTTEITNQLLLLSRAAVVYKASISYIQIQIESFLKAIQPLKTRDMTQMETQSLQRFNGLVTHFSTILPHLGQKWVNAVLNWPTHHIHNYIDDLRKKLTETCRQLSLDPTEIINYDFETDSANKAIDLQQLKVALCTIRETAISCQNSVDIQILINGRLNSINRYFAENKVPNPNHESVAAIPINELKNRMDKELTAFTSINIPIDDLKMTEKLGSGGFGTVYRATRLSTGELLAVKEVHPDKLNINTWASMYSEVATMAHLKHHYVLELVGAHIKEPYRIITRFCSGKSLFDRIHKTCEKPLTHAQLTRIAYQVAEGMMFLHENGIAHRDLKTMNILLDDDDVAKIADFGLCGMLIDNMELVGGVGTPNYTAPEVFERKRYGPKVDVYSYGIILWEMVMQQIPFRDKTYQAIYDQVVNKNWRLSFTRPLSENLKRLITRCWSANPNDRPEFSEIVQLFKKGKIQFELNSNTTINTNTNQNINNPEKGVDTTPPDDTIPFDYEYIKSILSDPSADKYSSLVNFLIANMTNKVRFFLRSMNLFEQSFTNCLNLDSVLLLASSILDPNEFPTFIRERGLSMIKNIISYSPVASLSAIADFLVKLPDENFPIIMEFIQPLIDHISSPNVGKHVIRFMARLELPVLMKYQMPLLLFFNHDGIESIEEQADIEAFAKLQPLIQDYITNDQLDSLTKVLLKEIIVPIEVINFLISKTSKERTNKLILALLKGATRSNVESALLSLIQGLQISDLEDLSSNPEIFDILTSLIDQKRILKDVFFLLFQLAQLPNVAMLIASHRILDSVLGCTGFIAMRLQILSLLYTNEEFCKECPQVTDGAMKLLAQSLSQRTPPLIKASLRFLGALSAHHTGCALLGETDLLQIFSQIFLSSSCANSPLSLQILINVSRENIQIPQASLIISCLMQDLIYSTSNMSLILITLRYVVSLSTGSVQEHDLQNSVMPLISVRVEPAIIVLALKLFAACEMTTVRNMYANLAERIGTLLSTPSMLFPELVVAAVSFLAAMSLQFDLRPFFEKTKIIEFIDYAIGTMQTEFPEVANQLKNLKYTMTVLSNHDENQTILENDEENV